MDVIRPIVWQARKVGYAGVVGSAPVMDGPLVTMCSRGERAAMAASVLERAGRTGLRIMPCGPDEWAQASAEKVAIGA